MQATIASSKRSRTTLRALVLGSISLFNGSSSLPLFDPGLLDRLHPPLTGRREH
jgi:hypothetical protein